VGRYVGRYEEIKMVVRIDWSTPELKRLEEYAEQNLKSRQIAVRLNLEFNTGRTRNSILGKLDRLGLTNSVQIGGNRREKKKRDDGPHGVYYVRRRFHSEIRHLVADQVIDGDVPGENLPLEGRSGAADAIVHLRDAHCRWPIGDPTHDDFHYCCRPALIGSPYCEHHRATGTRVKI
jgi:GcrA cell cycle regulator